MSYMHDVERLDRVSHFQNVSWRGYFAHDVTDINQRAMIEIPEFDNLTHDGQTWVWGPCRWQSRDATSLPRKGDACLLMRDQDQEFWVIAWWPREFDS